MKNHFQFMNAMFIYISERPTKIQLFPDETRLSLCYYKNILTAYLEKAEFRIPKWNLNNEINSFVSHFMTLSLVRRQPQ